MTSLPDPPRLSQILGDAMSRTSICPSGCGPAVPRAAVPHGRDYLTNYRCHICRTTWTVGPAQEVAA